MGEMMIYKTLSPYHTVENQEMDTCEYYSKKNNIAIFRCDKPHERRVVYVVFISCLCDFITGDVTQRPERPAVCPGMELTKTDRQTDRSSFGKMENKQKQTGWEVMVVWVWHEARV